jgi:hypothetical protein
VASPPNDHIPAIEPEIIPAGLTKPRRGPKTDAGKAAVRLNAVGHGLTARDICIPGLEDPAEWEAFRDGVVESLQPEGALEDTLASNVAEMLWRLRRVAPAEAQVIAVARERVARDYARKAGFVRPMSYEEGERQLQFARDALEAFAAYHHDPGHTDPMEMYLGPEALHEFVSAVVGKDPAMPVLEKETVGARLGDALGLIGERAKRVGAASPEELGEAVLERLERSVENRQRYLLDLVEEQDRMTRERLLPSDQALANVARHEAHLNRQLSQYMSQLEALQARRRGQPAPFARVHFTAS